MDMHLPLPVLVLILTAVVDLAAIPVFQAKGTHYEVGIQIGTRFQKEIQTYFTEYTNLRKVFVPWHQTPQGRKIFGEYLAVVESTYPQFLEEIAGYAMGANVSVEEVQLINFRVELETLLAQSVQGPDACTDVFVNNPVSGCVALGHNEDNIPIIAPLAYIVDVHTVDCRVHSSADSNCKEEMFTAYAYPGELPGTAFGFNDNGLIFSGNALYPKNVLTGKTGRQIFNRAIQGAKSTKEVVDILTDQGHGAAYGYSINIGVFHGPDDPPELFNFEVAPDADKPISRLSTYQVLPPHAEQNGSTTTGSYYHVNIYRRMQIPEKPGKSSVHRTSRIQEMPIPQNLQDIQDILGDTKDQDFPIFRRGTASDNGRTLCTAVYNLKECRLDVYDGNPKLDPQPVNTFVLPGCSKH